MSDLLQIGSQALAAASQNLDRAAQGIARSQGTGTTFGIGTPQGIARTYSPSYPPPTEADDYLEPDWEEYAPSPVFSPPPAGSDAVFAQEDSNDFQDDPIVQALDLLNASSQYQAAANLMNTGADLSATLLQTIA